ncbi:MAG: hypothetical protein LBV51_01365 [Acholeplasmatales bacterium]|jgi:bifunctional DNA-binding transcriptional regulator/antitoxin component of YhaV-PrlF toxin-antitoxin module|nr:hypothetical protein [Acholeplasmatales bacterium]
MKLLVSIVNKDIGLESVKIIKEEIKGFCLEISGYGTASSEILQILGLNKKEKDIVLAICDDETSKIILERLSKEGRYNENGTGIAFSIPLSSLSKSSYETYIGEK